MDIFTSFGVVNKSILNVVRSVNVLTPVEDELKQDYIRLEENPFVLTEDAALQSQVVTAHNLFQYKNSFHGIELEEDVHCWLEELLNIDLELEEA